MGNAIQSIQKESHKRTLAKSISWRIIATLTTFTIVYFITGKLLFAAEVGLIEVITKMTFYYFHERAWGKVSWGKKKHPLSSLPLTKEILPEDMEKIKEQLRDLGYID